MEPVIQKKTGGLVLLLFVFVALIIPLIFSTLSYAFAGDLESLSNIFFRILLRSLGFGFAQAAVSAVLACSIGLCVGIIVFENGSFLKSLLGISSHILFVLPGTAISLLTIAAFKNMQLDLPPFVYIVAAHALWSGLFVAHKISSRLQQEIESGGNSKIALLMNSGATTKQAAFHILKSPVLFELRQWFPLILSWSFSSFSTVLLLGRGPEHSTPEVLLYFTILNDLSPARILILMIINFLVQFLLFRKFICSESTPAYTNRSLKSHGHLKKHPQILSRHFRWLAWLACLAPLYLIMRQFLFAVEIPSGDSLVLIVASIKYSLGYAVLTSLFVVLISLGIIASSTQLRGKFILLYAISPTLLAAAWIKIPIDDYLWNNFAGSLFLCSLLLAVLQTPLASLWLGQEIKRISLAPVQSAFSLGMPPSKAFWQLYVPACFDNIKKLAFFAFVFALGEVALASIWMTQWPNLALLSRKFSENYAFSSSSFVFCLNLLLALAFYALLFESSSAIRKLRRIFVNS